MPEAIPVLGTCVYSRPDLLIRLAKSIDYPVLEFVVVNNNPKSQAIKDAIEEIRNTLPHLNLVVHQPRRNMGCSGGWNLILKHLTNHRYVYICGDDIQFVPEDLEKIAAHAEQYPDEYFYATNMGFNVFGLSQRGLETIGDFDENFVRVYWEDTDYCRRYQILLDDKIIPPVNQLNTLHSIHGEPGKNTGSCTSHSLPPDEMPKHHQTFVINEEYYLRKWGGGQLKEIYKTPFNDPNKTIKDWTMDESRLVHY